MKPRRPKKESGNSQDLSRAYYLKRLFDKQMDKADPKDSHEDRLKSAQERMDKKLGPEWRQEISRPGVQLVEVELMGSDKPMNQEELESFYHRVQCLGDQEGLGNKDTEAPEDGERPEQQDFKDQVIERVTKFLRKVL